MFPCVPHPARPGNSRATVQAQAGPRVESVFPERSSPSLWSLLHPQCQGPFVTQPRPSRPQGSTLCSPGAEDLGSGAPAPLALAIPSAPSPALSLTEQACGCLSFGQQTFPGVPVCPGPELVDVPPRVLQHVEEMDSDTGTTPHRWNHSWTEGTREGEAS